MAIDDASQDDNWENITSSIDPDLQRVSRQTTKRKRRY